MNERPIIFNSEMVRAVISGRKTQTRRVIKNPNGKCPYGVAGDQLWVRETFSNCGGIEETYYKATDKEITEEERLEGMRWSPSIHMPRWLSRIQLEVVGVGVEQVQEITEEGAIAEGVLGDDLYPYENGELPCPSCNGQGVHGAVGANLGYTEVDCYDCDTHKKRFKILWNSINKKRGFGWKNNPPVRVVEFKVLSVEGSA